MICKPIDIGLSPNSKYVEISILNTTVNYAMSQLWYQFDIMWLLDMTKLLTNERFLLRAFIS